MTTKELRLITSVAFMTSVLGVGTLMCIIILLMLLVYLSASREGLPFIRFSSIIGMILFTMSIVFCLIALAIPVHDILSAVISLSLSDICWSLATVICYVLWVTRMKLCFMNTPYQPSSITYTLMYIGIGLFFLFQMTMVLLLFLWYTSVIDSSFLDELHVINICIKSLNHTLVSGFLIYLFISRLMRITVDASDDDASSDHSGLLQKTLIHIMTKYTVLFVCMLLITELYIVFDVVMSGTALATKEQNVALRMYDVKWILLAIDCVTMCCSLFLTFEFSDAYYQKACKLCHIYCRSLYSHRARHKISMYQLSKKHSLKQQSDFSQPLINDDYHQLLLTPSFHQTTKTAQTGTWTMQPWLKTRSLTASFKRCPHYQWPRSVLHRRNFSDKPRKPGKWKRRGKVLAGLGIAGYASFKALEYYTIPKFNDDNFVVNEDALKNLQFVGKHAAEIKMDDIPATVKEMKQAYQSNITRPLENRRKVLEALYKMFDENEDKIVEAVQADLGRDRFMTIVGEVVAVKGEIKHLLANLEKYNAPKRIPMAIMTFPAVEYEVVEPYGTVFINSIWNFPFGTTFGPAAGAIAAGNNVVIKPCQTAFESSKVMCDLVHKYVDPKFIQIIGHHDQGNDYQLTDKILDNEFDLIFFTGSSNGGRYIMSRAAQYLTPVVLELGGKNPVIIDETADVEKASRQIWNGRTFNSGQVCIAPDYVLCDERKVDEFIAAAEKTAYKWFDKKENVDKYVGKMVNKTQFDRVAQMIKNSEGEIILGGTCDEEKLQIEPTMIRVNDWNDTGMQQETFGPVLWLKPVRDVKEAVEYISSRPKSLSLYMFSESEQNQAYVANNTSAGGMQINGTAGYIANSHVGFGGVGSSGMGQMHGDKTFYTFCHRKPVVKSLGEPKVVYPPRDGWKMKLLDYL